MNRPKVFLDLGFQRRIDIMKTQQLSLRRIVSYLNNPDEDGGFEFDALIWDLPHSRCSRDRLK